MCVILGVTCTLIRASNVRVSMKVAPGASAEMRVTRCVMRYVGAIVSQANQAEHKLTGEYRPADDGGD
jgi:hypothetical protein